MTTYERKPGTCEAIQFTGENLAEVRLWMDEQSRRWCDLDAWSYVIAEGDGRGFYPCVESAFTAAWRPVGEGTE